MDFLNNSENIFDLFINPNDPATLGDDRGNQYRFIAGLSSTLNSKSHNDVIARFARETTRESGSMFSFSSHFSLNEQGGRKPATQYTMIFTDIKGEGGGAVRK